MSRISFRIAAAVLMAASSNGAFAQFCPQNFDGVPAPALPSGWSASADGAGTGWVADTTTPQSPPNAAFAGNPGAIGNSYLLAPPTIVDASNSTFTFRHAYTTESTFDGGVLELSVGGGPFQDVVAAGGSFLTGGYNAVISTQFDSPIAGRSAWSGESNGYTSTIVRLPASTLGANVTLRWRMASDLSVAATGWFVDSIACGEVHDSTGSAWAYGASYPMPILDEAVTAMGGVLYGFGGVSGTATDAAYKFDGTQWTAIGALPVALEYPVAVNDGTHIYLLGGADGNSVTVHTLYRYTPQTNVYETMAPMPTAGWAVAAAVINGKIVRFGGHLDGADETNVTEIYDIASNTWTAGAAYPDTLAFISAFTYNGFVYGAGGVGASSVATAKAYRYDLAGNAWDDAPIPDLPDIRWGAATIALADGVLVAGGYAGGSAGTNISTTALVWKAASNTWQPFDALIVPRARMAGALLRGQPVVIGGRSQAGGFAGTSDMQVLDRLFANGFESSSGAR